MTALVVSVWTSDAATFIAYLPRREGVQFLDELNGDGRGQFIISLDDPVLTAHPTLLADGNVVKVRASSSATDSYSWRIQNLTPNLTDAGERQARTVTVSGLGQRTRLACGAVEPEGGLKATSTADRGFDFASVSFTPWGVSGDWVTPVGVAQSADPNRHDNPPDWPDPTAQWIWSSDPTLTAATGFNWFRASFTLAATTDVGIWCSADDVLSLRLNGETVVESDPATLVTWRQMFYYTATLAAGTHVLAARVENTAHAGGTNPGAFLATVASLDTAGIPVTVLLRTDTTTWKVHSYGPPEPGWHAASILKTLIAESQARTDAPLVPLTLGFSDTLDTAGVAWTDVQAERFNVGDDLLTVLGRLIFLGIDVEITPALVVNAYKRKGQDLSATLRLLPGLNITANAPTVVYGGLRNSALVRHATGWIRVEDSASIAAHGRRSAGLLSFGGTETPAQATQLAQAHFDETAHPQITLPITITSAAGPQPYTHFVLGDTLTVPGTDGLLGPARLMSIAATEGDGVIVWDLDFYPEVV